MALRTAARASSLFHTAARPSLRLSPPSAAASRFICMSSATHNAWAEPLTKPIEELKVYLAILPDFTEGSKRMDVRPQHLANSKPGHELGWIISAGATFAGDHGEHTPPKMTGSWFLMREESLAAARARLEKDVYVTGGAWDMSKATIQAVAASKI